MSTLFHIFIAQLDFNDLRKKLAMCKCVFMFAKCLLSSYRYFYEYTSKPIKIMHEKFDLKNWLKNTANSTKCLVTYEFFSCNSIVSLVSIIIFKRETKCHMIN